MRSVRSAAFLGIMMFALSSTVHAADHRLEKGEAAAPEGLSSEIAATLSPVRTTIIRGSSRTICHIWLCKEWSLETLEPEGSLLYPFEPGQLVGVVQYERDASDFRDQEIEEGVYTLRYAQQPVDGNHVGTSPTRDFLLVVPAAADQSTKPLDYDTLVEQSAEAVGTTHPGLLCMQRVLGDAPIRQDEEKDWWIVRLVGTGKAGDQQKQLPIDLVVVGQAVEF